MHATLVTGIVSLAVFAVIAVYKAGQSIFG